LNEALAVFTPQTDPQHYAAAQNQLGLAYLDLPTGDQAENLARAIACFEEALRFRLLEVDPMDYAGTQNNIGMALTRLEDGDRVAHLNQAVIHFQQALRFFTPGSSAEMHARVCNNLGTAYLDLQDVDPRAIQWAIDSFQNALRVCPDDASWSGLAASIQINLGSAYGALQGQGRAESVRQAGTYYEAALRALDPEKKPREAAGAWEGLGQAVRDGPEGEKAENLQRAIGCYRNAVALLDMNVFPADRRRVAQALGDLYLEVQAWGDAVDAYREAIVAHDTLYWIAATDVSRHGQLSQAYGLYSHRAYALAKMGYCEEAVEQLEAGRAQILAESL